jgi:hypothetical protein
MTGMIRQITMTPKSKLLESNSDITVLPNDTDSVDSRYDV